MGLNAIKPIRMARMVNFFRGHTYIFPRIVENYFRRYILRQPSLRYLEVALNYNCNADCFFCSCSRTKFKETVDKKPFSLEEIGAVIVSAKKCNTLMIGIAGGEPLLSPYLEDTVRLIRKHKILSLVASNGTLVTRDKLLRLKEAGLCVFCVSLHAYGKQHDDIVGVPGAFDKALHALFMAKAIGLAPQGCLTPTHESLQSGEFARIIDLLTKEKIPMTLDYPVPSGRTQGDLNILLNPEEIRYIRNLCATNPYVSLDLQNNYEGYSCPAGNVCAYVTAYGEVLPCPFIQISFGNLRQEPLEKIYARMSHAPQFKGGVPYCPAGESRKFVTGYLFPIGDKPPLRVEDHPMKEKGLVSP